METTIHKRPKVGLIGVTGYGEIYCDLILEAEAHGILDIVAVAILPKDRNHPNTLKLKERGAKIFEDYNAMLEELHGVVELYLIPTGIHWHKRMVNAALKAGANVLVEKPLAGSVEDAESIINCEEKSQRWVAVGFQDLYSPEVIELKQRLLNGVIGKIRRIKVIGLWPRPTQYYERNDWAGKLSVDGVTTRDSPLNNALAHFVNLAMYFAGNSLNEISNLDIQGAELFRAHNIESFDTAVVKAISDSNIDFWIGVSHACRELKEPVIRIEGDGGFVEWHHGDNYLISRVGKDRFVLPVPDYPMTRLSMFNAVLKKLQIPNTPICDSRMAMGLTKFVEKVHRAADICSIPTADIEITEPGDYIAGVPAIKGIESKLNQAFDELCMLRDLHLPVDKKVYLSK